MIEEFKCKDLTPQTSCEKEQPNKTEIGSTSGQESEANSTNDLDLSPEICSSTNKTNQELSSDRSNDNPNTTSIYHGSTPDMQNSSEEPNSTSDQLNASKEIATNLTKQDTDEQELQHRECASMHQANPPNNDYNKTNGNSLKVLLGVNDQTAEAQKEISDQDQAIQEKPLTSTSVAKYVAPDPSFLKKDFTFNVNPRLLKLFSNLPREISLQSNFSGQPHINDKSRMIDVTKLNDEDCHKELTKPTSTARVYGARNRVKFNTKLLGIFSSRNANEIKNKKRKNQSTLQSLLTTKRFAFVQSNGQNESNPAQNMVTFESTPSGEVLNLRPMQLGDSPNKISSVTLATNNELTVSDLKDVPVNESLDTNVVVARRVADNDEEMKELNITIEEREIEDERKSLEQLTPTRTTSRIPKPIDRKIPEYFKQKNERKQVKKRGKEDILFSQEFSKLSVYKRNMLKQEASENNESLMQCLKRKIEERDQNNKTKISFKKKYKLEISHREILSAKKRKLQLTRDEPNEAVILIKHSKFDESKHKIQKNANDLSNEFEYDAGKKPVVILEKLDLNQHPNVTLTKQAYSKSVTQVPPFKCSLCKTTFSNPVELLNHAKNSHNENSSNSKGTVTKNPYPQEDNTSEKTDFYDESIERLDLIFENAIQAAAQNQCKTSGISQKKTFNHNCKICFQGFKQEAKLKEHLKLSHNISAAFACFLCNMAFNTTTEIKVHINHVHETFVCIHCQKQFADNLGLLNHTKNSHSQLTAEFKCWACRRCFAKSDFLERHLRLDHPNNSHSQQSLMLTKSPTALTDQLQIQNPIKDGPRFSNLKVGEVQSLNKSVDIYISKLGTQTSAGRLQTKLGDPSFRCNTCDLHFHNRAGIEAHVKTVHLTTENDRQNGPEKKTKVTVTNPAIHKVSQPILKPVTLNKVMMEKNMPIYDLVKPVVMIPNVKCLICSESFSNMKQHNIHVQSQHKPLIHRNTKPLVLQEMTNLRNQPKTTSEHAKKNPAIDHKSVEGYKCANCFKVFAHKGFYEKHMRTVHKDQNTTQSAETEVTKAFKPPVESNIPSLQFICNKCGKGFANQILVARHVRTSHSVRSMKPSKSASIPIIDIPDNLFSLPISSDNYESIQDSDMSKIDFDDPMAILQKGLDELSQTLKSNFNQPLEDNYVVNKAKMLNDVYWSYLKNEKDSSFNNLRVRKNKRIVTNL